MSFIKRLGKIFKKSAEEVEEVRSAEPPPLPAESQEAIRKSAVRRKLKDIGYRTEEIRVVTEKGYEKGKGEKAKDEPESGSQK